MATRSPGFYYKENDNTGYINDDTNVSQGTTFCILGYATKGPIGVPVEINSYTNFKNIFGEPILEQYSGMAAKRILNSGGKVLFLRVANTYKKSKTNVVVKNGSPLVETKLWINNTETISEGKDGFPIDGKIYSGVLKLDNSKERNITIKTERTLNIDDLFVKLSENFKEKKASIEFDLSNSNSNSDSDGDGYFFVRYGDGDNDYYGPYFTENNELDEIKSSLEEKFTHNIDKYYKLFLYHNDDDGTSTVDNETQISITNGSYEFEVDDTSYYLNFDATDNYTVGNIVDKFNDVLKNTKIKAKFINSNGDNDYSYILFYNTAKNNFSINFNCDGTSLIVTRNGETSNRQDIIVGKENINDSNIKDFVDATGNMLLFGNGYNGFLVETIREPITGLKVEIDSIINTLIISSDSAKKISLIDTEIDTEIDTIDDFFDYKQFVSEFNLIDYEVFNQEREEKTNDYIVKKDKSINNGKICLYKTGSIKKITIEDNDDGEFYDKNQKTYPISLILGDVVDEDNEEEIKMYTTAGSEKIDSNTKDMIVFEAREYGSGTKGITVEVETETSQLDNSETKNIYVGFGTSVEKFLDISLDKNDDNYFEKIINQEYENGGSKRILVKVIKNDSSSNVVELKDGVYTLGKPLNDSSILKEENIPYESYSAYDYSIGNNGIYDEEVDKLSFIESLSSSGPLVNKDLYDFEVLITPDNIKQEVQDEAIKLCEKLEECFYIADPPQGLDKKGVIEWCNGKAHRNSYLDSNFAATYWPWLKVYDDTLNKNIWVMPSVLMAAQYASIDKTGPWNAPAGQLNGNIPAIDIEFYPNNEDRDELYTKGNVINPFVKYNDGTVLAYGAKTTQRVNSTLSKINVRRTIIKLKKELRNSLKGFIFRQGISNNIKFMKAYATTILDRYKQNNAISKYTIDTSKNTVSSLQQDVVYIDISVVPVGCIEEVNITLDLEKSNEIIG